MRKNLVLLILYGLLVVVGFNFFAVGHFSSTSFNVYFGMISAVALAFYASDRLKELDLRNLKIVLAEIKDVKKDVFAKADEVQSMMIDLADSYLNSAVETGRIAGDGLSLQRDMLSKRERARTLLAKAGLTKDEIEKKIETVSGLVAWDLLRVIQDKVQEFVNKRDNPNRFLIPTFGERDPELHRRVLGKETEEVIDGINDYITSNGLSPSDFTKEIGILRKFLDTETLPEEEESKI